ncbi:ricin-type beta-trefoil lectin domain protein [Roseibium polysiphoniae]|uniref:Ricin-type beta-trefoil lectin domain protein n=1 Tax=Roseibium polysiphoniae TaxID=2571221 RepID=A0ABR9C5Z3_9HYPH|nr:ricin-type beta-trefoil lectin domain protein [Roseibium polysiphoniae]MBD8875339.1 ricin-type beta-trefoil lectin domain protein [Roseibium polysiphoniae]
MTKRLLPAALLGTLLMAGTAHSEEVEIYLTDMLDNTQAGYCLDIARAQGEQANPDDGLQGHTCYSPGGSLGVDQTFETDRFAEGVLYMPKFDVCAKVSTTEPGTAVDLAECDGSQAQSFIFSGQGAISPAAAPAMCFTLGEDTRSGRSNVNQIKGLSLQACDEAKAAYQTWNVRSSVE